MVFFSYKLLENGEKEKIHISEYIENEKVVCIGCGNELKKVKVCLKESIILRRSHFRHKNEENGNLCEYEKLINRNSEEYINNFHEKWTIRLIKNEYLYRYWYNKNIADIYFNKKKIIVRNNLLNENNIKREELLKDDEEELVWILNYEKREMKIFKYEKDEKIKYFLRGENNYDLILFNLEKSKIFIDYKSSYIFEIVSKYDKILGLEIKIIKIDIFVNNIFENIKKSEFEKRNETLILNILEKGELYKMERRLELIEKSKKRFDEIINYIELFEKILNDENEKEFIEYKYNFYLKVKNEIFFIKYFLIKTNDKLKTRLGLFINEILIKIFLNKKIKNNLKYKMEQKRLINEIDKSIINGNNIFIFDSKKMKNIKHELINYFDRMLNEQINRNGS